MDMDLWQAGMVCSRLTFIEQGTKVFLRRRLQAAAVFVQQYGAGVVFVEGKLAGATAGGGVGGIRQPGIVVGGKGVSLAHDW